MKNARTARTKRQPPNQGAITLLLSRGMRFALFSLTLVAGWVDAMTFLGLGKVFSSFMSGNVLFLGIAAGAA